VKNSILLFCLSAALIFAWAGSALACWMEIVPFEVLSEDGTRVFVFEPGEEWLGNANAAVYSIDSTTQDHKRELVYTVKDLSSFAYESNFYFSSDMNHFARKFNESGAPIFEIFSKGIRTKTVKRSDIIRNHAQIKAETSIGPMYKVNWAIKHFSPQEAIITITTDEGNTIMYDLTTSFRLPSGNIIGKVHEIITDSPDRTETEVITDSPDRIETEMSTDSPDRTEIAIPVRKWSVLFFLVIGGLVLAKVLWQRK
jgi:hypothetical protein